MRLAMVGNSTALSALEPLLRDYPVPVSTFEGPIPDIVQLRGLAEHHDAVWVIGDRRRGPRTVLPGPFIRREDGRAVPLAWMPDLGAEVLRRFALATLKVHRRRGQPPAVAILGQWTPQYLNLADRIERLLGERRLESFRWTSERLIRRDLVQGLGVGLGLGIYVGHGRPTGWVGYRGTKIRHLEYVHGEPMGALISLTCHTASRRRVPLTFCEAVPAHGVAAAALGAVGPTQHTDNARWAVGLAEALGAGCRSFGELIVAAAPALERAVNVYRIVGDPFAPLAAAEGCLTAGRHMMGEA